LISNKKRGNFYAVEMLLVLNCSFLIKSINAPFALFLHENWQFSNSQELARELRPAMDALSYVFDCRHASASCKDVMKVASFFYLNIPSAKGS
jgi:hypothetical protein